MDPACNYVLATSGGNINFNTCNIGDWGLDCMFVEDVTGLDGATIRNPIDNAPITDGGLVHSFYEGPIHAVFSGLVLVQSSFVMETIRETRNAMVDDMRTALRSILRADGTLTWTEPGVGSHTLTVRYEQPLVVTGREILSWTFGLASAASTPS